jgi:ABC-2 type transport system ATP-binding protein
MIYLTNVSKQFGSFAAVNNISISIKPGEIFGFVGPDGAGKTTTMRMIIGILDASSGEITVLGKSRLEEIKSHIGYVPQKFSLYGDLTVMENIRLIGSLYGASKEKIKHQAEEILTFTKLWSFQDRLADNLSGGMKQKLALAAGLMHKPELFFLDEPTTGVDPVSRREFWQMLYRLNKEGMTIIVSTPYMDEAELCTRIAFFHAGKIVACDSPEQLRRSYPYRILEIQAGSKDIKRYVSSCPIIDINSFGEAYHVVVNDLDTAKSTIEEVLTAAGISIFSIREVSPTLEDVFVHLADEVM